MIDIHHHLLWEQDDGAKDLALSLDMAHMAVEDGITHIACTPHANGYYTYDPVAIDRKIVDLQHLLDAEALPLILGRGCDFHMSYDNVLLAMEEPARFSLNRGSYLLVELPDYSLPPNLTQTFYEMHIAGLVPILTHPERNATLQQDPGRIAEWLRAGVLVQVTAGSVTGRMGKTAQKVAHELLSRRWVHFLATDAHNTSSRPPKMREAHDAVAEVYGSEYAHLLCVSNPLAAFTNDALAPQPPPSGLHEGEGPTSWWRRLLGG
jgi:protein-tyrosine phosphatase